ncbi:MAG: hypothetical protein ABI197_05990 [Granulicella sp.]
MLFDARNPAAAQPGLGRWGPVVDGHNLPRNVWDPSAPEFSATVRLMIVTVLNEMGNSIQMGNQAYKDMPMDEVKRRLSTQCKNSDAVIHAPDIFFASSIGIGPPPVIEE